MKQHIPNLITLLNAFCGCIATVFAVTNQLELTAVFVFLGIFLDFFDGFAARMLKVQSDLGIQLDSLADMITSGLVPGIVMFQLFGMSISGSRNLDVSFEYIASFEALTLLPFFGFLITLSSAYRLAKFNIDDNQVSSFVGLPTPANALLILSLPLIVLHQNNDIVNAIVLNQWFLIGLTLLSSYLLNSKIRLFALKFKDWGLRDNALRYLFIIVSLLLLIFLQFLAVPIIIICYILSSVLGGQRA